MRSVPRHVIVLLVFLLTFMLVPIATAIHEQQPYSPCKIPAVVSYATQPNVLIVMDYSGSMQFPAYIWFQEDQRTTYASTFDFVEEPPFRFGTWGETYDPSITFYGQFDFAGYYVYNHDKDWFQEVDAPPVAWHRIESPSAQGSQPEYIRFIATGHDFAVDNWVVFKNLSSHEDMNGNAYRVASVSGNSFEVETVGTTVPVPVPWNGIPDDPGASGIKRVLGHVETGLSGNFLNYVATTRVGAALRALIGGRADCDSSDPELDGYCLRRHQGAVWRRVINFDPSTPQPGSPLYGPGYDPTGAWVMRRLGYFDSSGDPHPTTVPSGYYDRDAFLTITNYVRSRLDPEDHIPLCGPGCDTGCRTLYYPSCPSGCTNDYEICPPFCPEDPPHDLGCSPCSCPETAHYDECKHYRNCGSDVGKAWKPACYEYRGSGSNDYYTYEGCARPCPVDCKTPAECASDCAPNCRLNTPKDFPDDPWTHCGETGYPACPDKCPVRAEGWLFTVPTDNTKVIIEMNVHFSDKYKHYYWTEWQRDNLSNPTERSSDVSFRPTLKIYRADVNGNPTGPVLAESPIGGRADEENGHDENQRYKWGFDAHVAANLDADQYVVVCSSQNDWRDDWELAIGGYYMLGSNMPFELNRARRTAADGYAADEEGETATTNSPIGTLFDAALRIKVPEEDRRGVVQSAWDNVHFGLMFYRGSGKRWGKMVVDCNHNYDATEEIMVSAFQGDNADPSYPISMHDIEPNGGTPTGPAMWEAFDYFRQEDEHSSNKTPSTNTSLFIGKDTLNNDIQGTTLDPWYSPDPRDPTGQPIPVPCRQSYILLLTDGAWNTGQSGTCDENGSNDRDPLCPAYHMHRQDIRTLLADYDPAILPEDRQTIEQFPQSVTTYAIFAFAQLPDPINSMKSVAAFGGYKNRMTSAGTPCGGGGGTSLPYTFDFVPSDSLSDSWPRSNCNPEGTYDADCCLEWDTSGDGLPENFFFASDGARLEKYLLKVLQDIMTRNAAASSVATVSQQVSGGDILVRGAFEAADLDNPGTYLWRGHLESYWPFEHEGNYVYDFQMGCNAERLCYQMPGGECSGSAKQSHCMDVARIMGDKTNFFDERKIWAGYDKNVDGSIGNGEMAEFAVSTDDEANNWLKFKDVIISAGDIPSDDDVCKSEAADPMACYVKRLINWTRGADDCAPTGMTDCNSSCYRSRVDAPPNRRAWPLADIVYSTPVIHTLPGSGDVSLQDRVAVPLDDNSGVEGYLRFRAELAKQLTERVENPTVDQMVKKMIYVGGNDGMLHAFVMGVWNWDEARWEYTPDAPAPYGEVVGKELWAYIPNNLLGDLHQLALRTYGTGGSSSSGACAHRTMVDLSPEIWQVYIDHDGDTNTEREWRSVIVGGERAGGDTYFAIDITDPDHPNVLWEFSAIKDWVYYDGSDFYPGVLAHADKWTGAASYTPVPNYDYFSNEDVTRPAMNYNEFRKLPMTWSVPQVGRLIVPPDKFFTGPSVQQLMAATDPTQSPNKQSTPSELFAPAGNAPSKRHVVFVGNGFRIFKYNLYDDRRPFTEWWKALRRPNFMAIDIETGKNLFRYIWPQVAQEIFPMSAASAWSKFRPNSTDDEAKLIPYAMSDVSALDLWSYKFNTVREDGYVDTIYSGDVNGYLYGIKLLNFVDSAAETPGIWIDIWPTKASHDPRGEDENTQPDFPWSDYRSIGQPLAVKPAVSFDKEARRYLRVIFGTGKYDNVLYGDDDKSDPAAMSFYNLKDKVELNALSPSKASITLPLTSVDVFVRSNCLGITDLFSESKRADLFTTGCSWTVSDGLNSTKGDSCVSGTADPCWNCVWDLRLPSGSGSSRLPGERVTNNPLIAGGLVFFTTYVPNSDPCSSVGEGYLYIFDYMCKPFPDDFNPINDPAFQDLVTFFYPGGGTTENGYNPVGVRVSLGTGLPSAPVLDSTGQHVIIQSSNADLLKIGIELIEKGLQIRGWTEKEETN